jgi:hypothetical protein
LHLTRVLMDSSEAKAVVRMCWDKESNVSNLWQNSLELRFVKMDEAQASRHRMAGRSSYC